MIMSQVRLIILYVWNIYFVCSTYFSRTYDIFFLCVRLAYQLVHTCTTYYFYVHVRLILSFARLIFYQMSSSYFSYGQRNFFVSTTYPTVTLPKPTVARRSVSQKLENRATSADCRPTSAPILADFFVGRRLFCRSTQVKRFVDRSPDFQGVCHRWSFGRWSPNDRPTIGRDVEDLFIKMSTESRPIIRRQSADDRQTVAGYRCHSADDRQTVGWS